MRESMVTLVPTFAHEAVLQMFTMCSFALAMMLTLRFNRTCERRGGGGQLKGSS